MKQTIRYYTPVALLLVLIVAMSALLTVFTGTVGTADRRPQVVTTVYPLYVAAQTVIGDTAGVELRNLSGTAGGCLHDYQLSPADRIVLQQADLLLLNGAGAEHFLDDLLPELTATVVDTSAQAQLLCTAHEHEHEEHEHHANAYNEHLWTSPTRYAAQVAAVTEALCQLDPAHAAVYTANGQAYRQQILALGKRLQTAAEKLPSRRCITFHDSLAYLVDDLGLDTAVALQVGEDSGVSAGDLSAAQQALTEDPATLLLYDSQYTVRYTALEGLVDARQVLAIDTAVTGEGSPTDWLTAMEHTLTLFESITEGME